MYWYAKAILIGIIVLIIGIFAFIFRQHLPSFSSFSRLWPFSHQEKVSNKPEKKNSPTPAVPPVEQDPHILAAREKLRLASQHLQAGELLDARNLTENVMLDPAIKPYSETWFAAVSLLSSLNTRFLFSSAPCPEKVSYTVKNGDSLWKISRKFKTTIGMIQRANNLNETRPTIFPGQVLKIYQADWNIQVSKSHRFLLLRDGTRVLKGYLVGIGREDRTPVGTFIISNKQSEPVWTPPGRTIPYGDKENVLGTRWLGLAPTGETDHTLSGYGIHGTWEPKSIGKCCSNGCIRMLNKDVEEVFDIVPEGTPVTIQK